MALVLAVMMVLGVATAMAAEGDVTNTASGTGNFTISITNVDESEKHQYAAYQIFAGDLAETEGSAGKTASSVLSNITWGANVNTAGIVGALKTAGLTIPDGVGDADASKIAEALGATGVSADVVKKVAQVFGERVSVASATAAVGATSITGLKAGYYLVKDIGDISGEEAAKTTFMLEVVHSVEVTQKADVPEVEKKVKEKNDSTGVETDWQDAADYDINDVIPYKITGTLPSNFADYKTYKTYTFTDTLSAGLNLTEAQVAAVTVTNGENGTSLKDYFDVNYENHVLTVSLKDSSDLKTITGLEASKGIVVSYNATLTEDAVIGSLGNPNDVDLTYSNNPNYDGDGEKDTGKTPKDTVIVFTYEFDVNKVDKDKEALKGAGFTLYKKTGSETIGEGADAVTTDKWTEVKVIAAGDTTEFKFKGEDAGTYKLVETTVPAGYNKADDVIFTVTGTYAAEGTPPALTALTVSDVTGATVSDFTIKSTTVGTKTSENAIASTDVVNNQGATLPSTGGVGTQMFYIGGGLLALVAVVLLVTKRRVGSAE